MHETVIAWHILDKVRERVGLLDNAGPVQRVSVKVGEFTNVDPESLTFAFDSMKGSYPDCKDSALEIQVIQTVALCREEEHFFHAQPGNSFRCPECGAGIKKVVSGEELEIFDIELTVIDQGEGPKYAWTND